MDSDNRMQSLFRYIRSLQSHWLSKANWGSKAHWGSKAKRRGLKAARSRRLGLEHYEARALLANLVGTASDDTFVLTYSSTLATGNVSVIRLTPGLPNANLGTFPMNQPLHIDGLAGNNGIRIDGTTGNDVFIVQGSQIAVNASVLTHANMATKFILGSTGEDTYRFDADSPLGLYRLYESGVGNDVIEFTPTTTTSVQLNLGLTTQQSVNANLSLILNSTTAFEGIRGGSRDDTLTGNASSNLLDGAAGNDVLDGSFGNDTLIGGLGNDSFVFKPALGGSEADTVFEIAGQGTDLLDFSTLSTSVVLNLGSTASQNVHANRTLTLNSEATIENAVTGSGADTLTGNSLNNVLNAGLGDDILAGGLGSDVLAGTGGNDTYHFHTAIVLEADSVTESAGGGTDSLRFDTIEVPVSLDLSSAAIQNVHANRTLKLNSGSVFENAYGGTNHDTLLGNALANRLEGNTGNDNLNGFAGNDVLVGGGGDDTYGFTNTVAATGDTDRVFEFASGGNDTISFEAVTNPVTFNLGSNVVQSTHLNRSVQLNLATTFENVIGGTAGDSLIGNALGNRLVGGPGNDTLSGGVGSDRHEGGLGDDTYIFGTATTAEADTVVENTVTPGFNTLDFSAIAVDLNLNVEFPGNQSLHTNRTLLLQNFTTGTRVFGGSGNDTIIGTSKNDVLFGNAGNDRLEGGLGSDVVTGGTGNDSYVFGDVPTSNPFENDELIESHEFGIDLDTVDFGTATQSITFRLDTNVFQTVQAKRRIKLTNLGAIEFQPVFENAVGGLGNDSLTGNALANILIGNRGNDTLVGLDGRDIIIGGDGADQVFGGSGDDILIAGITVSDNDIAGIFPVRAQWILTGTYINRIIAIRAIIGPNSVSDDESQDRVTAGIGEDWFIVSAVEDLILDYQTAEVVDPI